MKNYKVIIIAIFTIVSLVGLSLISFGPLNNLKKKPSVNPGSLHPVVVKDTHATSSRRYSNFTNIDVKENHYLISIPSDWKVGPGASAGSYSLMFNGGTGQIKLMDIPDNTTVELYVLSQRIPKLQATVNGYHKIGYKKFSINGRKAYQIIYNSQNNGKIIYNVKVYIAGSDHAAVISLSSNSSLFSSAQPVFQKIINSFNWQNK